MTLHTAGGRAETGLGRESDTAHPAGARIDALLDCLEVLHAALLEHEDATTALRAVPDATSVSSHLHTAEAVIDARLRFYRCLVDEGWSPPGEIAAELALDEAVVRLTTGAIDG